MASSSRLFVILSLFLTAILAPVLAAPLLETEIVEREPILGEASSELDAGLEKRVTHNGQGTWFYPGLGACGKTNKSTDLILAISAKRWGGGGNCGQYVHITNTKNGKSAYGKVVDECPGCSDGSLDLSPSLFKKMASLDQGVIPVKWNFMPKGWSP